MSEVQDIDMGSVLVSEREQRVRRLKQLLMEATEEVSALKEIMPLQSASLFATGVLALDQELDGKLTLIAQVKNLLPGL